MKNGICYKCKISPLVPECSLLKQTLLPLTNIYTENVLAGSLVTGNLGKA